FKERLEKAHQLLPELEEELHVGEWGEIVDKSRFILELFEKDVTQFVKKVIASTTGVSEDKATDLTTAISKLSDYASDLHHIVDKGKIKGPYTGGKEDAYLAYFLV